MATFDSLVVGVDEAGRGPLAGPVVAAAVILSRQMNLQELKESKQLGPKKREILFKELHESGSIIKLGFVSPREIDRINILQATLLAMKKAVMALRILG